MTAGAIALNSVVTVLSGRQPDGFALADGLSDSALETFVVVSVRGIPRLMLPPARPAMRAALTAFLGERFWIGAGSIIMPQAAKLSRNDVAPLRQLSLQSATSTRSPMRDLVSSVIQRDDYSLALRLSFGRPNAKTVAAAISHAGEVLCFAKFGSEALTDDLITHESRVIERFAGPDSPLVLPRILYSGTWSGNCSVLITQPLHLSGLSKAAEQAHRAIDTFTAAHQLVQSSLRESVFWTNMRSEFHHVCSTDDLQLVAEIERIWGEHNFEFGVSHGDWSRANVGLSGDRIAALDWERFCESAPRGIDTAHFAIIDASMGSSGKRLNIRQVIADTQRHIHSAGRDTNDAKPLVALALLDLVLRFKKARQAGVKTKGSIFEDALRASLRDGCA